MFAASKTDSASTGGYQISRSLRFNSADSAYLNRTPASAGNRTTWTYSTWLKLTSLANEGHILDAGNDQFVFYTAGNITLFDGSNTSLEVIKTTQVFRDFSAWYHVVLVWDTTQATASNRVKLYINGSQVTAFATTNYPAQNATLAINNNVQQRIGAYTGAGNFYFNGYMTEVNFIDGQALTPSSFGETNAQTGVWQPKAYSGSYGTNGFYLNFSDNSNTTAATLGKDYSGNGNNWTPNGFLVSAGANNDSLVDSPTSYGVDTGVGGTVRGNYATLNPLIKPVGTVAYSNGNLEATNSTSNWNAIGGTIGISTGKWYWEYISGGQNTFFGIQVPSINFSSGNPQDANAVAGSVLLCDDNQYQIDYNARVAYTSTSHPSGTVVGVAVDMDAGTIVFYLNGTSQGSITWTSSAAYGKTVIPMAIAYNSGYVTTANFGQRPFAYTAPSGYKALCTQNLPVPAIGATSATLASKYFAPTLYTGNGTSQTITTGFMPNLVWIKSRSNAQSHFLHNNVDNVSLYLSSNNTSAEGYDTTTVTAISSTGFSLGTESNHNGNGNTYVAWGWNASGSSGGTTNTAGSITSTVSANTTSGFSVVTYTGNATSTQTVGHGIGIAPSMVIVKARSAAEYWYVWAKALNDNNKYLFLNTNGTGGSSVNIWQNTAPTSTVFSLGNDAGTNGSGTTQVAYCFAEVAGYSKFGSYTGNGSTDGVFVFTGMRPAFVMLKNTTTAGNSWHMIDTARGTYNVYGPSLDANASSAEITYTICDLLSNGFKFRDTNQAWNKSGDLYIYMAFAENPFKFSLAR